MHKEALLSYFPKITPKRYSDIIQVFSSLDNAWERNYNDLRSSLPWEEEILQEFIQWKNSLDEEKIIKELEKQQITTLSIHDAAYPPLLKQIYDPPFCLFVRGTLPQTILSIAIVGTRKFTPYGKQITEILVPQLVTYGLTIVSGLALGIDGIAHQATLGVGGKTIGVLGSGLASHIIYPAAHRQLAQNIIEQAGALVSEYPPSFPPTVYSFPRRNRIIAGLTLGTVVIEADEGSGALITASSALDTNREVFAVPQNITSPSAFGPNNLIKQGATLISSANDIMEVLQLAPAKKEKSAKGGSAFGGKKEQPKPMLNLPPNEAALFALLSQEPIHIDELTKASTLTSPVVNSTLSLMEIKGIVKNMGGMKYIVWNDTI